MDSLGSLGVFVQAAETRSFTMAAQQLGVSPSAVGKAIARLEDRLGVRLFHRSTRSITLTAEGAVFLQRCKRIFDEVELAEMEIAQTMSAPRGKLRVGLPLLGMLLTPAIGEFIRAYPDIEVELDYSDRMVDVIEEGFDIVMRTGDATDSRLKTRTLGTFSHKIVGSPCYFQKNGIPVDPEGLMAHKLLHHKFPSTGRMEIWPLRRDGEPVDLQLPVAVVASTLEPLINLSEQGAGLCCVPMFAVRTQIENGRLMSVLDDYLRNSRTFRVLWPANRHSAPKVEAFVNFMSKNLFKQSD